jgi:hypothetical protein
MSTNSYSDSFLRTILTRTRTVATVGVSENPIRPSHYVARYMSLKGYRVLPVNPRSAGKELFGETVVGSLAENPAEADPVQMVDIFRRSEEAGRVVDEAIETLLPRGLETIWMQIGVIDEAAAQRAEAKGLTVVMNLCPKMEHQRLFGELRRGGINTGIISSRRP